MSERYAAGSAAPSDLRPVLAERFAEVVVTRGAGGAAWFGPGGGRAAVEPEPVAVVDSTGGGDAFAAGFLDAWLDGAQPRDALAAGCAVAARVVVRAGARPPG